MEQTTNICHMKLAKARQWTKTKIVTRCLAKGWKLAQGRCKQKKEFLK